MVGIVKQYAHQSFVAPASSESIDKYVDRPDELENITLVEFVCFYTKDKKKLLIEKGNVPKMVFCQKKNIIIYYKKKGFKIRK